jgi:hypothetical protein
MVPGVDYYITLDDKSGKLTRSDNLKANLKNYQLYQALLQGGDAILWPAQGTLHPISGAALDGGSYLTRLRGETKVVNFPVKGVIYDPFVDRINQSAHVPIAEEIISIYVDTLFRQMIDRKAVEDALGEPYMADVDMLGHNAEDFLAFVYTMGLALGWVGVLTDLPRLEPGEVPSKAHEEAIGLRPYSRVLSPTRIWDWLRDSVTGELTYALIHESPKTWRIWTAEGWWLVDEEARVIESDMHEFGQVPIDLFIAQEPTAEQAYPPIGVSAINSSALLQLQVDQHQSLADDLQRKTNFPFVHIQMDPEQIADVEADGEVIGPGHFLFYAAELDWKAPPDTCLKQVREHISDLESKIYKAQGVHRRSQDSVEAHSGLALDFEAAPIYATVQAWSRRLRAFENRFWQTVGSMIGAEVAQDIVSYPEDFSVRPVDLELRQAEQITKIYGGWEATPSPVKSYIDLKVATAMKRDKGHLLAVREMVDDLGEIDYDAEPVEATEPTETQTTTAEPELDENGEPMPVEENPEEEAEEVEGTGDKIETENAVDPTTALNGAQVTSLREIVLDVASRAIPRETGVAMLVASFPLDAAQADAVMGPVGRTFFAETEPVPEQPGGPPPPPPPPGDEDEADDDE